MFIDMIKYALTTLVVALTFYVAPVSANQWEGVYITQCEEVTTSEAEFYDCRRMISRRELNMLSWWSRHAWIGVQDYSEEQFTEFQNSLYTLLKMQEGEFQKWADANLPFKLEDPLHYAVVVGRSHRKQTELAAEANRMYREVAGESVESDARRFDNLLRLMSNNFRPSNWCERFLPDRGCPE